MLGDHYTIHGSSTGQHCLPSVCSLTVYDCTRSDYEACEGRWETTNRHFYVDLPAEKRMVKPEYYNTAADTSHHIHAALANEAAGDAKAASVQGGPCGRAGARGIALHHPAIYIHAIACKL